MKRDERGGVGAVIGAIVGALVLFVGVPLAVYFLVFASAGVRGHVQLHNQVHGASNLAFQYGHFFDIYADVKAQTQQVSNTKAALVQTTDPAEHTRLNSVLLGLQNLCQQNTQTYNQDARKVLLGANFRDHNLPDSLPDGPNTNCGANA